MLHLLGTSLQGDYLNILFCNDSVRTQSDRLSPLRATAASSFAATSWRKSWLALISSGRICSFSRDDGQRRSSRLATTPAGTARSPLTTPVGCAPKWRPASRVRLRMDIDVDAINKNRTNERSNERSPGEALLLLRDPIRMSTTSTRCCLARPCLTRT